MDKRMINIDDLVRQRLGGIEEGEERTGGWLQMRELLDKEMPVNIPGAAFNWRRTLSYMAGLLLLASVSVGGYEAAKSYNRVANASGLATNAAIQQQPASSSNYTSNNLNNNNTDGRMALATANDKNEHSKQGSLAATRTTKNKRAGNNDIQKNTNTIAGNTTASNNVTVNNKRHNNDKKYTSTSLVAATTGSHAVVHNAVHKSKSITPAAVIAGNTKTADHKKINSGLAKKTGVTAKTQPANTKSLASAAQKKKAHSANTSAIASKNKLNNNAVEDKAATENAFAANKPTGNTTTVKDIVTGSSAINAATKAKKDSIDVLTIEEHYSKKPGSLTGSYSHDTTSEERIAAAARAAKQAAPSASQVALPVVSPRSLIASAATPQGKMTGSTANNNRYASASTPVVPQSGAGSTATTLAKKKATGMSMADKIEEALSTTKQNINGLRFTPGLLAGVNSTFGPNSFGGFHLGVSGEFTINNNWSLMAELRYLHQFTGNTAITDNYGTYSVPQPNTWERDSILHSFNFSTLHTIDLPISVRYKTGNFMIFLGGELVYNFSINYNESIGGIHGQLNSGAEPTMPSSVAQKPFVDNSDFVARFGAGYLFGVGYQLTPQFDISLRMMQTVWDNSKSASQKAISNDLYRNPSLQLSIGYKLNDSRKAK